MIHRLSRTVPLLALLASAAVSAQQAGALRAGVAKVDITPTADMFPIVQGMQVLGGVHDPIHVRALVLDNGVTKVALLGVETANLRTAADSIVKAVADELRVPASHLSVAATHDHNTPTFGGGGNNFDPTRYLDLMQKGIVEAARRANANLKPARIGYGTGTAFVNTNRDQKIGDSYKMGYAPERVSDKTVAVMLVTDAAGQPMAVWSNYAVHNVVMFTSKTRDGKSEITGDLGGWTSNYVEDRLKSVVSVWTSGAAGDQNPLFMSLYNQDAPDVHDEGAAGWAILDVQSRRLGEEVVRVANSIRNTTDRAVLWGANATVTCPGRIPDPTGAAAATVPGSFTPSAANARMIDGGEPVKIPLGLIMINDIALANVTGEVFTDISQKLKRESLFDRTAMVTLSGGSIGYIPSESAYLLPSAMAARNRIRPGCAEAQIVSTFIDLQKQYLPVWTAARR